MAITKITVDNESISSLHGELIEDSGEITRLMNTPNSFLYMDSNIVFNNKVIDRLMTNPGFLIIAGELSIEDFQKLANLFHGYQDDSTPLRKPLDHIVCEEDGGTLNRFYKLVPNNTLEHDYYINIIDMMRVEDPNTPIIDMEKYNEIMELLLDHKTIIVKFDLMSSNNMILKSIKEDYNLHMKNARLNEQDKLLSLTKETVYFIYEVHMDNIFGIEISKEKIDNIEDGCICINHENYYSTGEPLIKSINCEDIINPDMTTVEDVIEKYKAKSQFTNKQTTLYFSHLTPQYKYNLIHKFNVEVLDMLD